MNNWQTTGPGGPPPVNPFTCASGISGASIVGFYVGSEQLFHGFLATPMPQLAITLSGNTLKISWPQDSLTSWTLQQNPDLTTTNWTASGGISDDGTNYFIHITVPAVNLFFRLRQL